MKVINQINGLEIVESVVCGGGACSAPPDAECVVEPGTGVSFDRSI